MRVDPLKLAVSHAAINRIVGAKLDGAAASIISCRGGLFNASYKIKLKDGRWVVLRVAPHPTRELLGHERGLMRREVFFGRVLRSRGLPSPVVLTFDSSRKLIDRDYMLAECMTGANWFYLQRRLPVRENDRLFGELGALARRLHEIQNPERWFGYGAPFEMHRRWSEFVCWHATSLARDMARHTDFSLPAGLQLPAVARRLASDLDEITVPRLIHGDLWPRNILIDREISAVLDCDRALWGDPFFEWVIYGYPMRPPFWKAYGRRLPKAGAAYRRLLFYRSCGAIQAALELVLHFRKMGEARRLFEAGLKDLTALQRLL